MPRSYKNLSNIRFGKLTVESVSHKNANNFYYWNCVCECGNRKIVSSKNLSGGSTNSCGCLRKMLASERQTTHGLTKLKRRPPYYSALGSIIARCCSVKDPAYPQYGGRGIKICDRWLNSFENFSYDIGTRPSKKHTLDRIDNDGNYEASNIRWATMKEQAKNRRTNKWLEYNGVKMIHSDWAEKLGLFPSNFNRMLAKHGIEALIKRHETKQLI